MLETVTIKNIAVIDSAEISFKSGLNIISGETGAGKSIVLEAISLILGGRASAELIRSGCDEAVVTGLFETTQLPWLRQRMERMGFGSEARHLLIKRMVHRTGRHRIYINGELATLAMLQELCDGLVDLCGQHEHQSLLKAQTQMELLDRYGGLMDQVKEFGAALSHFRSLVRERNVLQGAESDRASKADFLKFQVDELRAADLQTGEDERLQTEKQLLQSAESRVQTAEAVRGVLESEDTGVLEALRLTVTKIRSLSQLDPKVCAIEEGLERALAEVEEAGLALNKYVSAVDLNPERLVEVQDRLSMLADMRRKYGATVTEMLGTLSRLETEYSALGNLTDRLAEVCEALAKVEAEARKMARKLSAARKKVADLLATSVTQELKELKMDDARLMIEVGQKDDIMAWSPATGADQIQFVVQTNRGEVARPLGKIASGGELSRMMLAIRRVIVDRGGIGVYLFDEIDAGIGGQTAFQVGRKLKSVAKYNQVICITHLPQVASFADHHLSVRKTIQGKRTATEVIELSKDERKQELARMLGGPQLTKKSLENAAELLSLASS